MIFTSSIVLKEYDLSDDELKGQGNDGGIDGFYLFVNGGLVTREYRHPLRLSNNYF